MQQRGRKSAGALTAVTALPSRMLEPPGDLTAKQAAHWRAIVATKPADWFQADTAGLLKGLVRALVEADRVALLIDRMDTEWLTDDDGLDRYDRLVKTADRLQRIIASNSTKLRLTHQSQYGARAAATKARGGNVAKPWGQTQVLEHEG